MPVVFISHTSADKYFVDLLTELLYYHHIDIWYDKKDIQVGSDYREDINKGLADSDYLIIVVSTKSCDSKWVTREIASYQAKKGLTNVIPVMLEKVDPDKLFDGLRGIQGILFYENMLAGFQSLMKVFDKEFLPVQERRVRADRREIERRGPERRRAPINQRLRIGLWKTYEKSTGIGKFERCDDLTTFNRLKVVDSFNEELMNYEVFTKDGNTCNITFEELDQLTYVVREELCKRDYVTAVIFVEAVAEEFLKHYDLKTIDRRNKNTDRRDKNDRRGD